ncbi:putative nuclease HARBI1 [Pseudophryne corroboree]|uniref:putative nuclease HARBI1 n=1 Tax=Pseudophryne corroboree TaxID=495146 RepID=UPI003081C7FE
MATEGEDMAVLAMSEVSEGVDGDAQEMPPSVESAQVAVPRPRLYRTRQLLDGVPEAEVIKLYRLSSHAIYALYDILEPDLEPRVATNHAVPGLAKLLASLHFFASGRFQPTVSLIAGFSQATFSRSLFQVLTALKKHTTDFIKFPQSDSEWREIKSDFFSIAGMPNVLGALDCMHVALTTPRQNAECFRNRRDFHSLNVQMVSDANQRILNVVVGFPGSTHDSYILRQSALFRQIEEGSVPYGWLLGDTGYRSRIWLLTPMSEPVTAAEKSSAANCKEFLVGSKCVRENPDQPSLEYPVAMVSASPPVSHTDQCKACIDVSYTKAALQGS